jgi:hypothetical protein
VQNPKPAKVENRFLRRARLSTKLKTPTCISLFAGWGCQRFDMFLGRRRASGDAQRGMIVLDETTRETSLQKLSSEFRKVGTRWGVLKNIADTPFFVDSRASRLVQIADHVAYAVFRRYNAGDAQYFDIIGHHF